MWMEGAEMSVRAELLRNLRGYTPCGTDYEDDPAANLLNAYRNEVLSEEAEKIRARGGVWYADDLADWIDPEVAKP